MIKYNTPAKAGNVGEKTSFDCRVIIAIKKSGGVRIAIESSGKEAATILMKKHCFEVLNFFDISNADIEISDNNAPLFVLSARLECAIKQLLDNKNEFLPEIRAENKSDTTREQIRFSRMYLSGNNPSMMIKAGSYGPHGVIFDLEDAVVFSKKNEALYLTRNALRAVDFCSAERMVRINALPEGLENLKFIVAHHVNMILIPKCESAEAIAMLDKEVLKLKKEAGADYPIYYMPLIESALGVEKAFEIATSSPNIAAMAVGLEDIATNLGVKRTVEGHESFYARSRVVNACKAAKIQAIDSIFSDLGDTEGLTKSVKNAKALGFDGVGCIHPKQIPIIHENMSPTTKEIEQAKKIVEAYNEGQKNGLGVVTLGTQMIDAPIVKRAEALLELAGRLGML